jgi:5-methyltetrahydrofolate--homocysteine methyltransferase
LALNLRTRHGGVLTTRFAWQELTYNQLNRGENDMSDFSELTDALIKGDEARVLELTRKAMDAGTPAGEILKTGLIVGMDVVGEKMENEEMFIPEVLMSARAMGAAVEILKPHLSAEDAASKGVVVIGTVKGDLHDIGKNLVSMMLESAGLDVHNIGVDIAPDQFVSAVQEKNANLVCLSALLTTTMPMMKSTIEALVESGVRDSVKVLVGGAPVTQGFADEIGADGYAPDAGSAAKLAKSMV